MTVEDNEFEKTQICLWVFLLILAFGSQRTAHAQYEDSITNSTGQELPTDDGLPEGYGFPSGYQENAVQFVTEDGVALGGYILGTGSRGLQWEVLALWL